MKHYLWIMLTIPMIAVAGVAYSQQERPQQKSKTSQTERERVARVQPYTADLFELTKQNPHYRRVLFTGKRSQLVLMNIPAGQSIGVEEHGHVEQTIVIVSGSGQVMLDGRRTAVDEGDVIIVTPGTKHDLVNTGTAPLQLFTTYVPPNHIDGRVHRTKQEAERDLEDHRYGEQVK